MASRFLEERRRLLRLGARELVLQLTALDPGCENFQIASDFTIDNLIHHTYRDSVHADPLHDAREQLLGLAERLEEHSRMRKARALQAALGTVLSVRDGPRAEAIASALSTLYHLSSIAAMIDRPMPPQRARAPGPGRELGAGGAGGGALVEEDRLDLDEADAHDAHADAVGSSPERTPTDSCSDSDADAAAEAEEDADGGGADAPAHARAEAEAECTPERADPRHAGCAPTPRPAAPRPPEPWRVAHARHALHSRAGRALLHRLRGDALAGADGAGAGQSAARFVREERVVRSALALLTRAVGPALGPTGAGPARALRLTTTRPDAAPRAPMLPGRVPASLRLELLSDGALRSALEPVHELQARALHVRGFVDFATGSTSAPLSFVGLGAELRALLGALELRLARADAAHADAALKRAQPGARAGAGARGAPSHTDAARAPPRQPPHARAARAEPGAVERVRPPSLLELAVGAPWRQWLRLLTWVCRVLDACGYAVEHTGVPRLSASRVRVRARGALDSLQADPTAASVASAFALPAADPAAASVGASFALPAAAARGAALPPPPGGAEGAAEAEAGADDAAVLSALLLDTLRTETATLDALGDAALQRASRRLLRAARAPYAAALELWLRSGRLEDPRGELLIRRGEAAGLQGCEQWARCYELRCAAAVPAVYAPVQRQLLSAGKAARALRLMAADAAAGTAAPPTRAREAATGSGAELLEARRHAERVDGLLAELRESEDRLLLRDAADGAGGSTRSTGAAGAPAAGGTAAAGGATAVGGARAGERGAVPPPPGARTQAGSERASGAPEPSALPAGAGAVDAAPAEPPAAAAADEAAPPPAAASAPASAPPPPPPPPPQSQMLLGCPSLAELLTPAHSVRETWRAAADVQHAATVLLRPRRTHNPPAEPSECAPPSPGAPPRATDDSARGAHAWRAHEVCVHSTVHALASASGQRLVRTLAERHGLLDCVRAVRDAALLRDPAVSEAALPAAMELFAARATALGGGGASSAGTVPAGGAEVEAAAMGTGAPTRLPALALGLHASGMPHPAPTCVPVPGCPIAIALPPAPAQRVRSAAADGSDAAAPAAEVRLLCSLGWPTSLLVDEQACERYSRVLHLLLELQCARTALEASCLNLRRGFASARAHPQAGQRAAAGAAEPTHAVRLLRWRMAHCVNGIHDHLASRVLGAQCLAFDDAAERAMSLDALLALHSRLLERIEVGCFLHADGAPILETIRALLRLAMQLRAVLAQALEVEVHALARRFDASLASLLRALREMACTRADAILPSSLICALDFNRVYGTD